MATQAGLVRSFYGWLVRKERALKEAGNEVYLSLLPARRPTSLQAVHSVALHASRLLAGTEYAERARYWLRLFAGIQKNGWQGDVRSVDAARESIRKELKEALRGRDLAV